MGDRQRFKPSGKFLWDFFFARFPRINQCEIALQQTRQIHWCPADMEKAFGKARRGHRLTIQAPVSLAETELLVKFPHHID
ncbi:hypothetical protein ASC97_28190 [Rhizobium sp. Root1203]|nr:hypothetical protein ASC97_28190 [Rhizobium sp. Root1203]